MRITRKEKQTLLHIAFDAISVRIDPMNRPVSSPPDITDVIESKCGAFVSVYVDQNLRGCIGTFSEEAPLYKNVEKMAVSAASEDLRFTSIHPEELHRLVIEISILTPRKRIYDPSEIVIGRHGIYMKHGSGRGTLLPQVAANQEWSTEDFLGNCSKYKAGLAWDGWKNAELYTYEAIVFSSETLAGI
ncbi:MAG: AmmeMemoRadiSam system protein A [Bacteroidales bacterium]|nr:AmmeMemoRadiSam system protein A [Bacteroidales bacterium]